MALAWRLMHLDWKNWRAEPRLASRAA